MKVTKQIYSVKGAKDNKRIVINYDFATKFGYCLNMTGPVWCDMTYGFLKRLISSQEHIVTDSDLISHDEYIQNLRPDVKIYFVSTGYKISASKKRLKNAIQKLKDHGFKVRYFASVESFNKKTGGDL